MARINQRTLWVTQLALLTAIVVVLQITASFFRFGMFQLALVLVPIVIGGALLGIGAGAWLGFVFGLIVLLNGDAAVFYAFSVPGTVLAVMLKGIAAGALGGLAYKLLEKKNQYAAVISASIVVPIVNTGVFVLGCLVFFMPLIAQWAGGGDAVRHLFIGVIGLNFFIELGSTLLLSGVILRIIQIWQRRRA